MPSDLTHRPPPLVTVSGALVAYIHTALGFFAFGIALCVALYLHYHKVVKNGIAKWPDEYWPSVSATIGDWYPERNLFQIGIALMSGPRFMLVFLSSLLVSLSKPSSKHAAILLFVGSLRTIAAGLFIYVTSSDDHDVHDIAMGLYIVLTPPWMYITSGSLAAQPNKEALLATSSKHLLANQARRMRNLAASGFFAMFPFMIFFLYRHKVLEIPGAYTHYSFFEWGLIIFDLLFDCASTYDLARLEFHIVEAKNPMESMTGGRASAGQPSRILGGDWVTGGTTAAIASGAWSTPLQGNPSSNNGEKKVSQGSNVLKEHAEASPTNFSRDLLAFCSESYLAFCFWTTLTGLHPAIFFFSVWNMAAGGHEALLFTQVLALGFALLPFVYRRLLPSQTAKLTQNSDAYKRSQVGYTSTFTVTLLHALSLIGLAVWTINDPLKRLLATAASCAGFTILFALQSGRAWELNQIDRTACTFLVGLLLSSAAKYANHSNNPAWAFLNSSNGGLNSYAFALALASSVERIISNHHTHKGKASPFVSRRQTSFLSTVTAGASLGALFFILHVLLTDSGTIIAWTWTGYPIQGPMALPHGRIVLLTSSISLFVSLSYPSLACKPAFWIIGLASIIALIHCDNWTGFAGALGMASFLPPLARPLLQVAMQSDPIIVSLFAWIVADLLAFLQVLTAAYAFIPGGMIMREKTTHMMIMTMALLISGLYMARKDPSQQSRKAVSSRLKQLSLLSLTFISLVALLVPSFRQGSTSVQPYYPNSRVFTAGIWTVHFSLDQGMWDSSRRMSSLIKDLKLDIVGLLETDLHRTVFGNRDMTQYLAQELNMHADIGPGPDKHTWGSILLSKFPIINSTHHLLPSPHGELAPAIHAVLDIYGIHTHVLVSHNGQEEDALDRELQTNKLAEIAREAYPHPFIFLGYVVIKPHASRPAPYEILFKDGKLIDVDERDLDRWCQYIGFRALERVGYVRVSRYTVTDTELQTAKFRVPRLDQAPIDPDRDVLPIRSGVVPLEDWIYPTHYIDPPAMVYNKHKYSPHYWPLYYVQ